MLNYRSNAQHSNGSLYLWIAAGFTIAAIGGKQVTTYVHDKVGSNTLKALILQGEAGSKGYNSYNRGSMRCAGSNRAHLNLTGMTLQQIQYYQSLPACTPSKLLAVGHYQIIPDTLNYCRSVLNIGRNTEFDTQTQDRIFALCLAGEKQPAIKRWIKNGTGLKRAAHAVANEWKIFKSPYTGRGTADGVGSNKARIGANKVILALQKARTTYVNLINVGLSEDDAYAEALGVNTGKVKIKGE